jgi:hypothetical protein
MEMPRLPFVVKLEKALSAEDFERSPLWGAYYEPDDLELILECGFDEASVRAAFEAADWADGACFPLPLSAADAYLMRGKFAAATVTTPGGRKLSGYVPYDYSSYPGYPQCVVVFLNRRQYAVFDPALPGSNGDEALAAALDEPEVLPLSVTDLVRRETRTFPASRKADRLD